jgi:hypothetical protein
MTAEMFLVLDSFLFFWGRERVSSILPRILLQGCEVGMRVRYIPRICEIVSDVLAELKW